MSRFVPLSFVSDRWNASTKYDDDQCISVNVDQVVAITPADDDTKLDHPTCKLVLNGGATWELRVHGTVREITDILNGDP